MTETLRRLTREDYRALPEGPPYYELIAGELVEMTRPTREHYLVSTYLIESLGPHARRLKGELAPEPNLYLPGVEEVYHPDLVYVAAARKRMCRKKGIYGAPDVVCEILSPTTERKDRGVKLEDYRRARVSHVWLITPESPVLVEEYVLGQDGRYVLNTSVTAPGAWEPAAFPGWRLDLTELDATLAPVEDEQE